MTYFDNNPIKICTCGRKFRAKGIDRHGNDRIYTKCMQCKIEENSKEQIEKYETKTN